MDAIIVYGSTTGNTELMATQIGDTLAESGLDVTVQNVTGTDVHELLKYDIILLGSSTWGDGDLQEDFIPLYDQLNDIVLNNKKAAAFGPGDSSYDQFCEAVNLLDEKLKEIGADIIAPGLKVDGDIEKAEPAIRDWAKNIASVYAEQRS